MKGEFCFICVIKRNKIKLYLLLQLQMDNKY